jgi:hypothetical protein
MYVGGFVGFFGILVRLLFLFLFLGLAIFADKWMHLVRKFNVAAWNRLGVKEGDAPFVGGSPSYIKVGIWVSRIVGSVLALGIMVLLIRMLVSAFR